MNTLMTSKDRSQDRRRRSVAAWYAPGAVAVATVAAMTLAACGPRDETPMAGGAPGVSIPADGTMRQPGQPVPSTSGQTVALAPSVPVAPAPVVAPPTQYAAAPTAAYPTDPAPESRPAAVPAPVAVPPAPVKAVPSNRAGEITSIEPIRTRPQGSGAGAVVGGVLGAVVGNQFGHGFGRAALTGAGAVGGALAGNNVERNYKEGVSGYRVVIRLDNGRTRVFDRSQVGNLHVGDRVRLDANSFHRA
jgi:outer membrane lipoprotein SlyB